MRLVEIASHDVRTLNRNITLKKNYCLHEYSCLSILPSLIIHVDISKSVFRYLQLTSLVKIRNNSHEID